MSRKKYAAQYAIAEAVSGELHARGYIVLRRYSTGNQLPNFHSWADFGGKYGYVINMFGYEYGSARYAVLCFTDRLIVTLGDTYVQQVGDAIPYSDPDMMGRLFEKVADAPKRGSALYRPGFSNWK